MAMPWRLATVCCVVSLAFATAAHSQAAFTRREFDDLARQFDARRKLAEATADEFAWSEAYMLRGYVEMFLATRDTDYLRRLVKVADQIIATRDDKRPTRAGTLARPLWSLGGKYTQARLTLKDSQGRDAIGLRSIRYAYNDQTIVTVVPSPEPGTFSLTTSNKFWKQHLNSDVTFENLSLDPTSLRYFERVLNNEHYILDPAFRRDPGSTPSVLLVAIDLRPNRGPADALARLDQTPLVPGVVGYYGYIGPIFSPMTRFAKLVLDTPALQGEFKPAAERYIGAATESLSAYEPCWRNGPGPDEGYYLLIDKGGEFWCDGIMAPWNYMGATGQVIANVWDWTKNPKYLDRLTRLATLYKRDCKLLPNGAYSWPYWSKVGANGWKRDQQLSLNTPEYGAIAEPDDISHASLEVEFAVMCAERRIVFNQQDLARFAKTFTGNIWQPQTRTLAHRVDGTGTAERGTALAGARWLELAACDPQVFEINRTIWSGLPNIGADGHAVGNYARMFRWQAALKPKP
jgi:hypothetical protein